MRRVLLFSGLLVAGLVASQLLPDLGHGSSGLVLRALTMTALAFIMIHVGYEFELDKSRLREVAVDYGVAATAAGFPWLFVAAWFVFAMSPAAEWGSFDRWKEALLIGRFAAPTSAGILFSMMAAAGLAATWLYRKARILAIFDDLDTVLLMIPLKMMIVGARWQLGVIVLVMGALVWAGWRWLHAVRLPHSWPWVLGYSAGIVAVSEAAYAASKLVDDVVPIHIEVLLPAFVLGCVMARPRGEDPHRDDAREGHQDGPSSPGEQRVAAAVSGVFMVLVGLSMPRIEASGGDLGTLALHVLAVTALANLGKMFPAFTYRREASLRERIALCVGMWPRGEVGAGVLVVSLGYGIAGPAVAVATLSLALNLVLTGVFILVVKRLLAGAAPAAG